MKLAIAVGRQKVSPRLFFVQSLPVLIAGSVGSLKIWAKSVFKGVAIDVLIWKTGMSLSATNNFCYTHTTCHMPQRVCVCMVEARYTLNGVPAV